ncbi:MAG: hypothetical protein VR69_07650 [Peptococcaceae bacterium BRH_c4b]|nr:MAG: hypothetical protein VR69_07650 [Peptococcaceae bacterium BRH_c4b]
MGMENFTNRLLALELDEVLDICRDAGIDVEVRYTRPPKGDPAGRERVVRFILLNPQKGELTVTREVVGKDV